MTEGHHTCKPHSHLADGALWAIEESHTLLQKPERLAPFLLQLGEAALDNTAEVAHCQFSCLSIV